MIYSKIEKFISNAKCIAIFSHINPDADALGSGIALKIALEKKGKEVSFLIDGPIHQNFQFLNVNQHCNKNEFLNFDLAICLDCPEPRRVGSKLNKLYNIKNKINIDHHPDNANYGTINLVSQKDCSTCSILFKMFNYLNWEITPNIATCLYSGIVGDTGRFKHNNTTSDDLISSAKLLELGAEFELINYNLFERMSLNEFELLKFALNKTEFYFENKFALICLSIQDLIKTNTSMQDTHILIDYLMNIESVKVAVVMTQEKPNEFRVSIRSRNNYNAQKIAKVFGGGGHFCASGCRIFYNLQKSKQKIINAVLQEVKRCMEL